MRTCMYAVGYSDNLGEKQKNSFCHLSFLATSKSSFLFADLQLFMFRSLTLLLLQCFQLQYSNFTLNAKNDKVSS